MGQYNFILIIFTIYSFDKILKLSKIGIHVLIFILPYIDRVLYPIYRGSFFGITGRGAKNLLGYVKNP